MISIMDLFYEYSRVTEARGGHLVATDSPVISWSAKSSRNEDVQSEYLLMVGDWSSEWVKSADNFAKVPAGVLKRGEIAEVSLQIRTAQGDVSQVFESWICDARIDWDAKWISSKEPMGDRPVYIRKVFNIEGMPISARVYGCGLGYHDIEINGYPLDESYLDPAHVDYSKRVNYIMVPDAEDCFEEGENEINVIVAPGWRDNTQIHSEGNPDLPPFPFEGPLEFSAIIEIETDAGKNYRITTDETWEAGTGPITYANIFNGEVFDANEEESYGPAVIVDAPGGKMEPMLIPPIVAADFNAPVAMWPDGEKAMIFDFGKNIAGVVRVPLTVPMAKGHKLILTHSEELTEDGKLFRDTLRTAKNEDVYIASGDDEPESWRSRFTYHGFRYARLEGILPGMELDRVCAAEFRTDVDKKSAFTCGNALITKIHDICVNTERANIHSILTDCPQRNERLGWMNDATVRFEETPYNFDIGALFPKVVRDIIDAQGSDGAITCTAPFVWGSRPADPVCSSFLVAGYEAAMHTGNLDIIREAYTAFEGWENCLLAHSDDYIVNYSYYGDWAGPADCCVPGDGVNPGAPSAVTPGIFMSTGYSYFNCTLLKTFAGWLGDAENEKKYAELAEKVKNALMAKWYDAEIGSFGTGSQACLAFSLWLGIAPEPAKTAKLLHEAVESAGWRITTGNLCSRYIMDALTANGYLETAWKLMTREEYPSIGFMIQQEATTVWERFELMKAPGMNSHNHPMYGAVDYWNYAYLAGIKCTDLGWKRFSVKPYLPEKLMSAQAVVDTVLGPVSVRWTKRYGGTHLQLNVPFGATADVDFCGVKKTVGSGFHTITVAD